MIIAVVPKERRASMAIKIIKPGKPGEIKRFTCSRCGCVFEADRDDYEKRRDDFRMGDICISRLPFLRSFRPQTVQ